MANSMIVTMKSHYILMLMLFVGKWGISLGVNFEFVPQDETRYIQVGKCANVTLKMSPSSYEEITLFVGSSNRQRYDEISVKPLFQEIASARPERYRTNEFSWTKQIEICGKRLGHTTVRAVADRNNGYLSNDRIQADISVFVHRERTLQIASDLLGWAYFLTWSVSSYPQIYLNYSRKSLIKVLQSRKMKQSCTKKYEYLALLLFLFDSVVGLSFDYVALTFAGSAIYLLYNCGMYFNSNLKREYYHTYSISNPVTINDLIFSSSELVGSLFIIYQCFYFERGTQTVSRITKFILVLAILVTFSTPLAYKSSLRLHWLNVLSSIELIMAIIKYIPQVVTNYRRKSTNGWSVVSVMLANMGSRFCMLQMIIHSYNYDDWNSSMFVNLAKFGLAFSGNVFNGLFIYQHYVSYRNTNRDEVSTRGSVRASHLIQQ